jgi:hypothetical protein
VCTLPYLSSCHPRRRPIPRLPPTCRGGSRLWRFGWHATPFGCKGACPEQRRFSLGCLGGGAAHRCPNWFLGYSWHPGPRTSLTVVHVGTSESAHTHHRTDIGEQLVVYVDVRYCHCNSQLIVICSGYRDRAQSGCPSISVIDRYRGQMPPRQNAVSAAGASWQPGSLQGAFALHPIRYHELEYTGGVNRNPDLSSPNQSHT